MKFLAKKFEPPKQPEPEYPWPVSVKVIMYDRDGKEVAVYDPDVVLLRGQTINLTGIGLEVSP